MSHALILITAFAVIPLRHFGSVEDCNKAYMATSRLPSTESKTQAQYMCVPINRLLTEPIVGVAK